MCVALGVSVRARAIRDIGATAERVGEERQGAMGWANGVHER